jgi:hypothetical protein
MKMPQVLLLSGLVLAGGLQLNPAGAAETACSVCTPPTGTLGFKWFSTRTNSSFTCKFGNQSISQSYGGSALVGFRSDGSIGAIRFSSGGALSQIFVGPDSNCQVNF